eukprot:IDg2655t1
MFIRLARFELQHIFIVPTMTLFQKLEIAQLQAYFDTIWAFLDLTEIDEGRLEIHPDELPTISEAIGYAVAANAEDDDDRQIPDLKNRLRTMTALVYPQFKYCKASASFIEAREPALSSQVMISIGDAVEVTAGYCHIDNMQWKKRFVPYTVVESTNCLGRKLKHMPPPPPKSEKPKSGKAPPLGPRRFPSANILRYVRPDFKCHRKLLQKLFLFSIQEG